MIGNERDTADAKPTIVAPDGRPARQTVSADCPSCRAPKNKRVLSSGFGHPHDVCGVCGHDFEERTIW